jgi:hypothetical protein
MSYKQGPDYTFWFALIFVVGVMVAFNHFVMAPMGFDLVPMILGAIR